MIRTMHIWTTSGKHNSEGYCARDRHVATKGQMGGGGAGPYSLEFSVGKIKLDFSY